MNKKLLFLLLVVSMSMMQACKKAENTNTPNEESVFDPPLSESDLQILEDASIKLDDYLDVMYDINGVSYRTLFNDPNFINDMKSSVANFRTNQGSVDNQIKSDLNIMVSKGAFLVSENENAGNKRPKLSDQEPEQQAYGYLQVNKDNRQLNSRVLPDYGNELYTKTYKFIGIDCSGFIQFCLKEANFPGDIAFVVSTFESQIGKSVKQKYNNNAELINLGPLSPLKLKPGDFMVSKKYDTEGKYLSGHIALIKLAGAAPIALNSNGTTLPSTLDKLKSNFEYPSNGILKRGICAKKYSELIADGFMGSNTDIYRIVPIIDKAQKESGDNQQGTENTTLPQPLKVRVLDKLGYGIEGLKVTFSIKSGGGQITSAAEVITDEVGIAAAAWKLGTKNVGEQRLEVRIANFKGELISQTPLVFSATFDTDVCNLSTFTDSRDGKVYKKVQIGTQEWMAENLNYATGNSWCYDDNPSNCSVYGRMYDWETAKTACPSGWHLPSDAEWSTLTTFLGGVIAGGKMKSTGTQYWQSPNTDATNSSCLSGLPGGNRYFDGTFYFIGTYGVWWSSSESTTSFAYSRALNYNSGVVTTYDTNKKNGLSVRCVRD